LRIFENYDGYNIFDFSIPIGHFGDCYDRFLIRIEEMRESLFIIAQSLNFLKLLKSLGDNSFILDNNKIVPPSRPLMKYSMNL